MRTTALIDPSLRYPERPPFHADARFPELARYVTSEVSDNPIQGALRRLFREAGLDRAAFDTPDWNPLGRYIRPGQSVVLKPNWVLQPRPGERCLITDGTFIRAVIDYVIVALRGSGTITICDAPIQSADFDAIVRATRLSEVKAALERPGLTIRVVDLRQELAEVDATGSKILGYRKLRGDPLGYAEIDLGAGSYLDPLCVDRPRVSFGSIHYDERLTNDSHRAGRHRYVVAQSVLDADAFVNLPKMKTHKKAGVTGALKNLVGINGGKEHVVHFHRHARGGDEFASRTPIREAARVIDVHLRNCLPGPAWRLLHAGWKAYKSMLLKSAKDRQSAHDSLLSYGGSWYGNATIWRMIYDLNTILFFADKNGRLRDERARRVLAIVDGVESGEGEGPLSPDARRDGILVLGEDPLSVDACLARLMGFDENLLPIIARVEEQRSPWIFSSYRGEPPLVVGDAGSVRPFVPPATWRGHIEARGDIGRSSVERRSEAR